MEHRKLGQLVLSNVNQKIVCAGSKQAETYIKNKPPGYNENFCEQTRCIHSSHLNLFNALQALTNKQIPKTIAYVSCVIHSKIFQHCSTAHVVTWRRNIKNIQAQTDTSSSPNYGSCWSVAMLALASHSY